MQYMYMLTQVHPTKYPASFLLFMDKVFLSLGNSVLYMLIGLSHDFFTSLLFSST